MKKTGYLIAFSLLWLAACGPATGEAGPTATPPRPTTLLDQVGPLPGVPTPEMLPAPTADPAQLALGETVYATQCAVCHGANLEGQPDWKQQNADGSFRAPPHDENGHTWHHDDATLLEAIRLGGARFDSAVIGGTSTMPAYGETLSDEEITAVLAYIKSHWSAETQAIQWDVTLQTRARSGATSP